MPTRKCPIRNPNIEEGDLHWGLNDVAECSLSPERVGYKITIEAFHRIGIFPPPARERLADWVSKQHNQSKSLPTITTETLKSLGLSSG